MASDSSLMRSILATRSHSSNGWLLSGMCKSPSFRADPATRAAIVKWAEHQPDSGVETPGPALSGWPVEALGEDQEPAASGDGSGDGVVPPEHTLPATGSAGAPGDQLSS